VAEVCGVASESFESTARRYIAISGFANRTIRSNLTAVSNLVAGLLTSIPVPSSIAHRLQLPALNHPVLAAERSPGVLRMRWNALASRRCIARP
jgi:hypothetical protein